MQITLNTWQRLNLGGVVGMSRGNMAEIKAGLALMDILALTDKEKTLVGIVLEGPQKDKVDEDYDFEVTIPDEFMEYLRKCAGAFAHWPTSLHVPDLEEKLKL